MPLVCKNLSYSRKKQKIYNNIAFSLGSGEIMLLRDDNDEIDLLYALSGIKNIKNADIIINNVNINKLNEKELVNFRRENMNIIFPDGNLLSKFNILENILISPELIGRRITNRDIDVIAGIFKLNGKLYLLPHELSYFEQIRVCFARAIATHINILCLYNLEKHLTPYEISELNNIIEYCAKQLNISVIYCYPGNHSKIKKFDKKYFIENAEMVQIQK